MKTVARIHTPSPSADPQQGQREFVDALLEEARKNVVELVALHHYIDGMRLADEMQPGQELLERFSVAASQAIGAVECARIELAALAPRSPTTAQPIDVGNAAE